RPARPRASCRRPPSSLRPGPASGRKSRSRRCQPGKGNLPTCPSTSTTDRPVVAAPGSRTNLVDVRCFRAEDLCAEPGKLREGSGRVIVALECAHEDVTHLVAVEQLACERQVLRVVDLSSVVESRARIVAPLHL